MSRIDVGRRRFIVGSVASAAVASSLGVLAACGPSRRDDDRAIEALRALLGGDGTVPALAESPFATPRIALDTLWDDASPREIESLLESASDLRAFLQARRRADFEAERVVLLDGWMLAESEFALAVVLAESAAGEH